jgi:polyphosphate kinase 2
MGKKANKSNGKKDKSRAEKQHDNLAPEKEAVAALAQTAVAAEKIAVPAPPRKKLDKKTYENELRRLQIELVKMHEWVKARGKKVVVIFEGRDAAGKGGTIKRITETLNPRICRVVALGVPTEKEKTQWYFQRYVAHLPAAGEIVLFDRSWYNRAGVEKVMGFCTEEEYREFLRSVPEFERMLIRSGIILIKYWFSVSDEEQERRFQARINDPTRRWKISPMDLESRLRWVEYSIAKDEMFKFTDTKQSPWYVVNADDKPRARLNCIAHLLSMIPYEDLTPEKLELPPRQKDMGYVRPPITDQTFVPEIY